MKKVLKYVKIGAIVAAVIGIAIFALILYLYLGVLLPFYNVPNDNKFVADYNPAMALVSQPTLDTLSILTDGNDKLELGINKDGNVVFKHPHKAFKKLKKYYKKPVWKYGDKELKMKHLSKTFYIAYSEEEFVKAAIEANPENEQDIKTYQEILKIYANSFNKHR